MLVLVLSLLLLLLLLLLRLVLLLLPLLQSMLPKPLRSLRLQQQQRRRPSSSSFPPLRRRRRRAPRAGSRSTTSTPWFRGWKPQTVLLLLLWCFLCFNFLDRGGRSKRERGG